MRLGSRPGSGGNLRKSSGNRPVECDERSADENGGSVAEEWAGYGGTAGGYRKVYGGSGAEPTATGGSVARQSVHYLPRRGN